MTVNPAVNPKKLRPYDEPPRKRRSLIPGGPDSGSTGFIVAAFAWLALATGLGGLTALLRFVEIGLEVPLGFFNLTFFLNLSVVEAQFLNALVFGWLTNAGFAAVAFMTPRLLGRPLVGEKLVFLAFLIWNASVLGGIAALTIFEQGPNSVLNAFPWFVEGGMATAALVVTGSFLATVAPALRSAYVSLWFAGIGLLSLLGFTGLSAAMGLADYVIGLPDLAIALASLYLQRATMLLWLLPMAFAVLYFVVPRVAARPLESSGLALLAWLSWLAIAPLAALSVVVDTSIPYFVTSVGNAATMALLLPIALTVVNLMLTVRGRWSLFFGTGPLAFALVAMAFLLAVAMLDAIATLPSVRDFVGGTEWQMGVTMWALLGAFTLAALAFTEHAVSRVLHRDWGATPLSAAQLWCFFAGATLAGIGFMGAGMAEGSFRDQGAAPDVVSAGLVGYHLVVTAGLGLAALGGLAALLNIFLAYTSGEPVQRAAPGGAPAAAAGH
jgi:cytochrome c oxidase cbb3-type subunit 1